jgi:hypothetical protein
MFPSLQYKVPFLARQRGTQLADLTGHTTTASAAYSAFPWHEINFDELNGANLGQHATKLIIQQEGWYIATCQVFYAASASGARGIGIVKNGSINLAVTEIGANNATSNCYTTGATIVYLLPGDYLEIYIYTDGGSRIPVNLYLNVAKIN